MPSPLLETDLKVLSFNVWGLRFVSKDRVPRMKAIAQYLATSDYDIVCLQEIWIHEDFLMVKREVEGVLPNARFFHTGALGSGLAILTRFPIIFSTTLPYSLSGLPLHVIAGDFFVNKAAASVVLFHPRMGELEVWNTHMHAAGEGGPETNRAHRLAQAWELSRAVRAAAERGRYVIACGDFNSLPHSLPMSILRSHAHLTDSWLASNPIYNTHTAPNHHDDVASLDAQEAIRLHGVTCDSPLNTYSAGKPLTGEAIRWKGKRLDYILFRGPEVAPRRTQVWAHLLAAADIGNGNGNEDSIDEEEGHGACHSSTDQTPMTGQNALALGLRDGDSTLQRENGTFGMKASTTLVDGDSINAKRSPALRARRRERSLAPALTPPPLRCLRSEVVLTGIVPGELFSFSDHFPLLSVFRLGQESRGDHDGVASDGSMLDGSQQQDVVGSKSGPLDRFTADGHQDDQQYDRNTKEDHIEPGHDRVSSIDTLSTVLQILQEYTLISRRTSKTHLRLFASSIAVALALTISSAWQPKSWMQPIWTLLGVATGAVGATMLYVGFVWGRWEEGLLREVMEEMEMELRLVNGEMAVTTR